MVNFQAFYGLSRLAPVFKTIFHQYVISYTCSQSNSDGSVLRQICFKDWSQSSNWVIILLVVGFDSLCPSQQFFSYVGTGLPGLNQYKVRINFSCSRTQRSDAVRSKE